MNVLMMGVPFAQDVAILEAYRSTAGHEIRLLACADAPLDTTLPVHRFEARECASDVVARITRDWRADILLCWTPEYFPPPQHVEACSIPTVAAVSDWNIFHPQLESNLARYDVVLSDKLGAQRLRLKQAQPRYWGPLYAQNPRVHRRLGIERDIDVLFVGNLTHVIHVRRARCLERLARLHGEVGVVIAAGHYGEDYARLLNRARIVFNHSVRGELNLRCFESLACGATLFLEHDNIEVRDWLDDGVDVVLYTEDTLVDLVRRHLSARQEAEAIATRGHAKAMALAGENRLDDLIAWCAAQPPGERDFARFPAAEQACATVMQYTGGLVESQQRLGAELLAECVATWAERPEFLMLEGAMALDAAHASAQGGTRPQAKAIIAPFQRAAERAPDSAPVWLNLAFACRCGRAAEAEAVCLERALGARSTDYSAQLVSQAWDPHYYAWRRACAMGEGRIETLWAMAAARLADVRLAQGRIADARQVAQRAIALAPEASTPYRTWASAERQAGRREVEVEVLERGLEHSVFDWAYRLDLLHAYEATGARAKACELAEESVRIFEACIDDDGPTEPFREALRTSCAPE